MTCGGKENDDDDNEEEQKKTINNNMRFSDMPSEVSYYFLFLYFEMETYINHRQSNRTKIISEIRRKKKKNNFRRLAL